MKKGKVGELIGCYGRGNGIFAPRSNGSAGVTKAHCELRVVCGVRACAGLFGQLLNHVKGNGTSALGREQARTPLVQL